MNSSDEPNRNDGQQSIAAAEPYRTPADVSDTSGGRGMFRSPIAWMVAIGAVTAVGGLLAFTTVRQETLRFGGTRGPVDAYEYSRLADYEREMAESELVTSVEE